MGNTGEMQILARGESVTDLDGTVVMQPDDIPGNGIDGLLPFAGKEGHCITDADFLVDAHVLHLHALFEGARADAHEGYPVTVARVHVGLDLEDEA